MKNFDLVAMTLKDANEFVSWYHRHHKKVQGHKFSLGALYRGELVGVAIVGRPVARCRDDGKTLEITRLCTDGTYNACSFLYGAAQRAARALGYMRLQTYILDTENGSSLLAANYKFVYNTKGGSWDTPSRRRIDKSPTTKKCLYEAVF